MYIGIDPGLRGAIVALNGDGKFGLAWDIPTCIDRGHKVVDVDMLADKLYALGGNTIDSLYIEEPFFKPKSAYKKGEYQLAPQFAMKARINSGVVYGMAKMLYRGAKLVQPSVWKRSVGIRVGSGKDASIQMAADLFPTAARQLHKDGRAEAALIAYHGMKMELYYKRAEITL